MPEQPTSTTDSEPPAGRKWWAMALVIGLVAAGVTAAGLYVSDGLGGRDAPRDVGALTGPPSPENFSPVHVVPRFPSVSGFQVLDADAASEVLEDDELVLAVEIDGQARAYPINMLTGPSREIINDQLAGSAIAATW